MIGALFVRAASHRYFFGDYFEDRYARRGFVAWPDYRIGRNGYDANFAYYRHEHAEEPRWERGLHDLYRGRANGDVARPPQTLVQQVTTINNITTNNTQNTIVNKNVNITNVQNVTALTTLNNIQNTRITNLASLSQTKNTTIPVRQVTLKPVTKEEHVQEQKAAAQIRQIAQQRHDTGAKLLQQNMPPVLHTDPPKTVKMDLPKRLPAVGAPPVKKSDPPPVKTVDPPAKKVEPPLKKIDPPAKKVDPPVAPKATPPVKKVDPPIGPKVTPPMRPVVPSAPMPPPHVEQPIPKFTPHPLPGPPKVQPPPPAPPKKK